MVQKILISYRREDSAAYAGRLADRLGEHFGPDNVFVDVDAIRPGEDFVDAIDQSLSTCTVLVAVIGRGWLNAADSAGRRRLERTDDFVRIEIAKALERHIRVIPALVGDASMPEPKGLPQDLVALTRRQAIEISDSRFHQDVGRLIEAVSGAPGKQPGRPLVPEGKTAATAGRNARQWVWISMFLVLAAVVLAWRYLPERGATTDGSQTRNPQAAATTIGANRSPAPSGTAASSGSGSKPQFPATTIGASGSPAPSGSAASSGSGSKPQAPTTTTGVSGSPAPSGSAASSGSGSSPEPPIVVDAPGKTGIRIVWRGANSAPCDLYDATGEKLLSPSGVIFGWQCGGLWDAAPGRYVVKVRTTPVDSIQVEVTLGSVTRIEPRVGQLRLHWNGANRVLWYLLDKDGGKTLSPQGVIYAWDCSPGQTCTMDVAPGDYMVKVDAPGYQPVRVSIVAFRVTDVTIP